MPPGSPAALVHASLQRAIRFSSQNAIGADAPVPAPDQEPRRGLDPRRVDHAGVAAESASLTTVVLKPVITEPFFERHFRTFCYPYSYPREWLIS